MKFYDNYNQEIEVFIPCKGKKKKKDVELDFLD